MLDATRSIEVVDTDGGDRRFLQALSRLFAGDGTVYLVSGYFTHQGYLAIRADVQAFLERSPENELVVVVGPASDQFSPRIARDLWSMDDGDQVRLYKYPRGLHAKVYLRDGPVPRCITGSGNITQVAMEYNLEFNLELVREDRDDPDVAAIRGWVEGLVADARPLRRRDLLAPVLVGQSLINWSNKARLLPTRNVVLRVIPVLVIVALVTVSSRLV